MKKRKHQFHCEKCGSPCEIYKKGKNHRVLVCPKCGVLATNPIPLIAGAALSLARSGAVKKGVKAVSGLVTGKKDKEKDYERIVFDSKDKPNMGERIINKELYGD